MAIGIIATLKIQDGKNAEAEAAFTALAAEVRANEPGNKLYQLVKSRTDASTYIVMEIYDDQAAVDAHRKSDHFRAAGPKIGAVLAGAPDVQLYDAV